MSRCPPVKIRKDGRTMSRRTGLRLDLFVCYGCKAEIIARSPARYAAPSFAPCPDCHGKAGLMDEVKKGEPRMEFYLGAGKVLKVRPL